MMLEKNCRMNKMEVLNEDRNIKSYQNDIGDVIKNYHSNQGANGKVNASLIERLASHLDASVSIPSFSEFPLDTLESIFTHPKVYIKDYHHIQRFLMEMLNRYKSKASPLFKCINLIRLTPEEALQILDNKDLDKSYIGETASDVAAYFLRQKDDLKDQMNKLSQRLDEIEQFDLEQEFDNIQQVFEQLFDRVDKEFHAPQKNRPLDPNVQKNLEDKLASMGDTVAEKVKEYHTRIINEERNLKKVMKDAMDKIKSVEKQVDPLRAQSEEMRRSIDSMLTRSKNLQESIANDDIYVPESISIAFTGHSFDGILAHLSDLGAIDPKEKNSVIITASSEEHGKPSYLSHRIPPDYFKTENKPNQWILFEFVNRQICVKNYSLRSHNSRTGSDYFKDWILEGSNDKTNFELIDQRTTTTIKGENKFQTFPAKHDKQRYMYIRLRRVKNSISLKDIEFFGEIYSLSKPRN